MLNITQSVYFMFLSTLLPTLVHLIIASMSLIFWIPMHWLKAITKGWKPEQIKNDLPKFLAAWAYVSFFVPLAFLAPFLLLAVLLQVLLSAGQGTQLANWLLTTTHTIAAWIDPSVTALGVVTK